MLAVLLLAAATCSDPYLSVHLAPSANPTEWPRYGPRPRFTVCNNCQEIDYRVLTLVGRVQIDPHPVLRIDSKHVTASEIRVATSPYEPERPYYELLLWPDRNLASELADLVEAHRNDVALVLSCSDVTQFQRITLLWARYIPVAASYSEADVRRVATRLGLDPKLIPLDRAADEERRVQFLRSTLSDYAGEPNARERIAREQPNLYKFLETHPKYWRILAEEEEDARRP